MEQSEAEGLQEEMEQFRVRGLQELMEMDIKITGLVTGINGMNAREIGMKRRKNKLNLRGGEYSTVAREGVSYQPLSGKLKVLLSLLVFILVWKDKIRMKV